MAPDGARVREPRRGHPVRDNAVNYTSDLAMAGFRCQRTNRCTVVMTEKDRAAAVSACLNRPVLQANRVNLMSPSGDVLVSFDLKTREFHFASRTIAAAMAGDCWLWRSLKHKAVYCKLGQAGVFSQNISQDAKSAAEFFRLTRLPFRDNFLTPVERIQLLVQVTARTLDDALRGQARDGFFSQARYTGQEVVIPTSGKEYRLDLTRQLLNGRKIKSLRVDLKEVEGENKTHSYYYLAFEMAAETVVLVERGTSYYEVLRGEPDGSQKVYQALGMLISKLGVFCQSSVNFKDCALASESISNAGCLAVCLGVSGLLIGSLSFAYSQLVGPGMLDHCWADFCGCYLNWFGFCILVFALIRTYSLADGRFGPFAREAGNDKLGRPYHLGLGWLLLPAGSYLAAKATLPWTLTEAFDWNGALVVFLWLLISMGVGQDMDTPSRERSSNWLFRKSDLLWMLGSVAVAFWLIFGGH